MEACSAAVWADGAALSALSEPMARGHQERLAPMVAEALAAAGLAAADLDRIAVTVGPGSFTGLRVGLAFARAFALALERPCIGVGTLEALAAGQLGFVAACLDARRGRVFLQAFADGRAVMAPDQLEIGAASARLAELYSGGPALVLGSGAGFVAGVLPGANVAAGAVPDPLKLAALAAERPVGPPPRPLYLRAPDA